MSDEKKPEALRPTDEQLAGWIHRGGFPVYYDDEHDLYLQGMFEELIERRADDARCRAFTDLAVEQQHRCQKKVDHRGPHWAEAEQPPYPPTTFTWPVR